MALQFASKYHVSLDSRWPYTDNNHVTAAFYYTAVEIRKNTWNTQTDREQRIQLQRPLLSPVDLGVSGPIIPVAITDPASTMYERLQDIV